jgi:hypothetical protein
MNSEIGTQVEFDLLYILFIPTTKSSKSQVKFNFVLIIFSVVFHIASISPTLVMT